MLHIYTFIAGYKRFYAITQHRGTTVEEATQDWLKRFSFGLMEEQAGLTKEQITILKRDVSEAKPVANDSFVSMWFVSSTLGKKEPIGEGVFGINILDTRLPPDGATAPQLFG